MLHLLIKPIYFHPKQIKNHGRVAQLNRVADYGSAGYRFESCRGHTVSEGIHSKGSLFQYIRTDDAIRRKRDSRHYAMG